MFFAISTPTYDLAGALLLEASTGTNVDSFTRRVTRTATLDGGCIISDGGYSASDRTATLKFRPKNKAQFSAISRLCQTYPLLIISAGGICASAAFEQMDAEDGDVTVTFLIKQKLSS